MKKLILLSALLSLTLGSVHAQLTSTVTTIKHDSTFSLGRDFWLAMQSNYWGQDLGGKYLRLYMTSTKGTNDTVESGGSATQVPIQANKIGSFKIPELWEMESSGIVENKAIHVFSHDADLAVYDLSHNAYTSDGSYIIPTIGWGTDYVVAAYGSLYEGGGSYVYDLPSTCVVIADQDSTLVTITPSCDCRQCSTGNVSGDANSTITVFTAGSTINEKLNRGQCMQLIPIKAADATNYDLTGTIIHANKPVGVAGGSGCPNIPAEFPYCDHVEDMIPPVRSWGETYYTTNPIQPPGMPGHDFGCYLFISSQAGQEINRGECGEHHTECIINNQYGIYWDELEGPQNFTSNAPFLVVEYINSASYPDNNNGLGDPAEGVVIPREQYTRSITFETPQSTGNIVPYVNYVDITVNTKDISKTLFDGQSISGRSTQCADPNWDIVTIPQIAPGAHTISGDDSGIGVWIYGYGYDESYAWSGPSQCKTFHSPDSIAPITTISGNCLTGHVFVQDTGVLSSKLDMLRLDTIYNIEYLPDTSWYDGTMRDSTFYDLHVIDPTKAGFLQVSAFDYAGNHTTITSIYGSLYGSIKPPLQDMGLSIDSLGRTPNVAYDTLHNLGQDTILISELHLRYGDRGFSIFDSSGGPLDLSPLAPGQHRLIQIQFSALKPIEYVDTIIFGTQCDSTVAALRGSGTVEDFTVTDQSWPNAPFTSPLTCYQKIVSIRTLSSIPITIDSVWWADTIHFHAISTLPITLPPSPGSFSFLVDYCPDTNSAIIPDSTQGRWFSHQVLESGIESPRLDTLVGWAPFTAGVTDQNHSPLSISVIPTDDGHSLEIIVPVSINDPVNFELVNVFGETVLHNTLSMGTQTVDASMLPRGVYFYRLTSDGISQSGKVILGE
jgi:hypothetical protein